MAVLPKRLDLNLLVSLDVLLAERHVTRAAARLGVSQPALSAQLRQLRAAFADPLLVSGPQGMVPTLRALELQGPLRTLIEDTQALISTRQPFVPAAAQHLFRVAATDAIHSIVTAPFAARLSTLAPGCRLAMLPINGSTLVGQLASGETDLAVLTNRSMPDALHARPLYDETFTCVMRRDHPAAGQPLDLDLFCRLRHLLVSPVGGGFTGAVDTALQARGRARQVVLSVNNFLLVPDLLATSDLVATVPARLARRWADRLALAPLPIDVAGFGVVMGWHPRTQGDAAQQWLREALLREVRSACSPG